MATQRLIMDISRQRGTRCRNAANCAVRALDRTVVDDVRSRASDSPSFPASQQAPVDEADLARVAADPESLTRCALSDVAAWSDFFVAEAGAGALLSYSPSLRETHEQTIDHLAITRLAGCSLYAAAPARNKRPGRIPVSASRRRVTTPLHIVAT